MFFKVISILLKSGYFLLKKSCCRSDCTRIAYHIYKELTLETILCTANKKVSQNLSVVYNLQPDTRKSLEGLISADDTRRFTVIRIIECQKILIRL